MTTFALCNRCGAETRPVVAVDIDGTLADYHGHFENFAMAWLGEDDVLYFPDVSKLYDGAEPYRDWFCRTFGVDLTTFRAIKLAYRQGGMKRTQPLLTGDPGRFCRKVRALGVDLWLTTTRPWERYDRVDPDTREWCRRWSIEHDALLYSDEKMAELFERVGDRVIAVVDDQVEVLVQAATLWPPAAPILRQTAYNRGVWWPITSSYLSDIHEIIKEKVDGQV